MKEVYKEWIIDTGACNHMISHKGVLHNEPINNIFVTDKRVYLPNGGTVDISHIGSCISWMLKH